MTIKCIKIPENPVFKVRMEFGGRSYLLSSGPTLDSALERAKRCMADGHTLFGVTNPELTVEGWF